MTEYTITLNGKRYELSDAFRASVERRARLEYEGNPTFDCYWTVARREDYTDEQWENNIHKEGDPLLVIDTTGPRVPWERLEQLEIIDAGPPDRQDGGEKNEYDGGGGAATVDRDEIERSDEGDPFGKNHFLALPYDYQDVPQPEGDDPNKIPTAPETFDDPSMVLWVPRDPSIDHTWSVGDAITSVATHFEWNVQKRADQPARTKDKPNSHDTFESLCRICDCEVIGEVAPSDEVPESGSVQRKGKKAFEDGKYGGDNWHV